MKTFDLTNDGTKRGRGAQEFSEGLKTARDRMRPVERQRPDNEQIVQDALDLEIKSTMTAEEIMAAKQLVDAAMQALAAACSAIQNQIDEANLRRETDGEFSDPDWYRRVHGALRSKKWQRQRIQDKLGLVNRMARQVISAKTGQTKERLFVEIARLHLPADTFQRLWKLVEATERV